MIVLMIRWEWEAIRYDNVTSTRINEFIDVTGNSLWYTLIHVGKPSYEVMNELFDVISNFGYWCFDGAFDEVVKLGSVILEILLVSLCICCHVHLYVINKNGWVISTIPPSFSKNLMIMITTTGSENGAEARRIRQVYIFLEKRKEWYQ